MDKLHANGVGLSNVQATSKDTKVGSGQYQTQGNNKFAQRLQAGRFRWVNEKLYTIKGLEAFHMFKSDPNLFDIYHSGFQTQVDKWPINPLDNIIDFIRNRSKDLIIADLGCGEGRLAQSVPNKVYSIDLASRADHIIACDMANTPLEDAHVDMVVFCLALMGTNLLDYVKEAKRILKPGGILLIAEVLSRIEHEARFVRSLSMFGFKLKEKLVLSKMFIRFQFVEVSKQLKKSNTEVANLSLLKPCVYKKR
ncbi:uncharacterized protein TRIADDRAFT_22483 [Trichoplax adhaerens]|uniref:Ribosomal RNA-processing protein 8 n=1 Tax=Trichoplax adhaerens TaxID=10228 RepID=B3RTE1_TRIAD|nr:hypothetical protein TRIADDRAFT_22483 [Trichoplax adhaerens]EDV27210.1 hypothetical protein TRIADDRAFT_22483 [Trichoplax adhaerens]|eukprot:XP_002111206.1 hypothetical protein TRIADDRAFT_22483 [Trichoplax adhaerens]